MGLTSLTFRIPALVWVHQALVVEASNAFPPRISRFDAAIDFKFQQVMTISCRLDGGPDAGLCHLGLDREGVGEVGLL